MRMFLSVFVITCLTYQICGGYTMVGGRSQLSEVDKDVVEKMQQICQNALQEEANAKNSDYVENVTVSDVKGKKQTTAKQQYFIDFKQTTTYSCKSGEECQDKEPETKQCYAELDEDFIQRKPLELKEQPKCK